VFRAREDVPCLDGIEDGAHFYFVHSYYVDTPASEAVAGETEYGLRYTSCLSRGRLFACQFHPEKSQADGLTILRNFGALCEAETRE
jgi:glutamine amidotransferase